MTNPYVVSAITTQLAFNTLLNLYGDNEIDKKNILVDKLQMLINEEYESQFSRYSTIISNSISKGQIGLSEILKIPNDKEKDFDKYIYLNTLYKSLNICRYEEKLNENLIIDKSFNKTNDCLYELFTKEIYKQIEQIELTIGDIENYLKSHEKKNTKNKCIKKHTPIWINWLIMGTITTGLFIGSFYFLSKNTRLFTILRKK